MQNCEEPARMSNSTKGVTFQKKKKENSLSGQLEDVNMKWTANWKSMQ